MRTLTLLAAIFLLALQTQAGPLTEIADEVPAQEKSKEDNQNEILFLSEDEDSAQEPSDLKRKLNCQCRMKRCGFLERYSGPCRAGGLTLNFCCR